MMLVFQTETGHKSWRNGKSGVFGKGSHLKLIMTVKLTMNISEMLNIK